MGLIIKLVIVVVVGAVGAVAARRLAAAAKAPISDDECVSCGSGDVRVEGAGIYVCLACGYEGGSGRAELAARAEADRYANLSPEERLQAITDHIQTATRILASSDPALQRSADELIADRGNTDVFDIDTTSLAGELSAAAAELRLAETIAGGDVVLGNGLTVDVRGVSAALLAAQQKLMAGVTMQTTAAEAHAYLHATLQGRAPVPNPPGPG